VFLGRRPAERQNGRVLGGCVEHRAGAAAATTRRFHAHACEGANENSWQSRPRHACASNEALLSQAAARAVRLQRRRRRQSRNASKQRDSSLQRPDRGQLFLLSRLRPAAPWLELGLLQTSGGGVAFYFVSQTNMRRRNKATLRHHAAGTGALMGVLPEEGCPNPH
jgi:hypothetical protein